MSAAVGHVASRARDAMASACIALGIRPNTMTVGGFVLTALAAICLVMGAGHAAPWGARLAPIQASRWPLVAAGILTVAFTADVLDGAVARVGGLSSRFGAFLDSTLDRFSDLLIFLGCAIHFALVGNATYVALSVAAAANALLISYTKARAENFIDDCTVGFWQRGERCGLFLAAAYSGHIPAVLWLLATLPMLTVIRRIRHAHAAFHGAVRSAPAGWVGLVTPWRQPRGSAGYDVCIGLTLLYVIAAPVFWPSLYGAGDPLRSLLSRVLEL